MIFLPNFIFFLYFNFFYRLLRKHFFFIISQSSQTYISFFLWFFFFSFHNFSNIFFISPQKNVNFFLVIFTENFQFLSFSHFLSTYLVAQLRKMFTFIFRSTLSTFSISWMHLFYYFSSNPRYEVTMRRTLRPIALKSFVNLKCMLTATSIKHRDMRLDFELCWARERRREREKSEREFNWKREQSSLFMSAYAPFSPCASCCVLRTKSMKRNPKEFWFEIILCMLDF